MHVYFSGIGGSAIGPLAAIAKQAGYEVSGSDMHDSRYVKYLISQGITDIHIGQSREQITQSHKQKPIDWFVYSSALPKTDPNHPELTFCREHGIKTSKRDVFLNKILADKDLKLIAVAGTHGKTTTTAMLIWLFKHFNQPISYSVGAKIPFGDMGQYDPKSRFFVYEADEYDRNFLSFKPFLSVITGIDWDHPDIYPTRDIYHKAFRDFIDQSEHTLLWADDAQRLHLKSAARVSMFDKDGPVLNKITLKGGVNRQNALLAAMAFEQTSQEDGTITAINQFPGLSRRFEEIAPNLYSDYAHTPPKIRGALQLAHEIAGDNVAVIYEGLHNTRQHFIKDELASIFDGVKKLYIVPSFLAREDKSLKMLRPDDLLELLSSKSREHAEEAGLNDQLLQTIRQHLNSGDLVLCLSAGGGDSLDEWLRKEFKS